MASFWDFVLSDTPKRTWDHSDTISVNEQPEPGSKRQCLDHEWPSQGLFYPKTCQLTPVPSPMSQVEDRTVSMPPGNIWDGFQDDNAAGNNELPSILAPDEELPWIDFAPDSVEQDFNMLLPIPGTSDMGQFLPTPDSGFDDPDFQTDKGSTSVTGSVNESFTPQSPKIVPYDVCFGMVITNASCHSLPKSTEDFIPVSVRLIDDTLKLFDDESKHNVGLLNSLALDKLARELHVTFSAKCEKTKDNANKRQLLGYKDTPVYLVIYGFCTDMETVDRILSDGDLFLQHPTQFDISVPYRNPQFLINPGGDMPEIEDLVTGSTSTSTTSDQCLAKKWASEIFQTFDTANGPATFAPIEPSPRLQAKLKGHQIKALAMMTEKERGILEGADFPSLWVALPKFGGEVRYRHVVTGITQTARPRPLTGGILADEMGLGKSLSVLALIAWYLDSLSLERTGPSSTLIVTTPSTIPGWQRQISRHIRSGQIRTVVFHGPNRQKLTSGLRHNDIVLTTYDTLRSEWATDSTNSALFSHSEEWARVVLDEAHHIRSHSSQTFQAACELRARYRWCLTGTPIQNRLEDYGALVSFIGVPPFTGSTGKTAFSEWVITPIHTPDRHARGVERLRNLVAATCLRRTKTHVQDKLELPSRVEKEQVVELDPTERGLYDFLKSRASSLVVGKVTQRSQMDKARWGTMLSLIGFLRLACNHGQQLLPPVARELYQERNTAALGLYSDKADFDYDGLEGPSINDKPSSLLTPTVQSNVVESDHRPSSKVIALLKNLQNEQRGNHSLFGEAPVKGVIFSYWTKMLDLLEVALRANNFLFQRIDGKTPLQKRSQALKSFNEDPSCTVMLASIGSVAEGVDLTAANFVHLVEPQWNPMVEAQATDRVHRIGQSRDVVVTRYIVKNSIEQYVQTVQQTKLKLVEQSFGDETTDQLVLSETRFQKLLEILL